MSALELLDALDDKLYDMVRHPVDANDIADVLTDLRAAREKVAEELKSCSS